MAEYRESKATMVPTICASGTSQLNDKGLSHFQHSPSARKEFHECGHYLEKLEFALAIAQTNGDQIRIDALRAQIAELGGNTEEPGT